MAFTLSTFIEGANSLAGLTKQAYTIFQKEEEIKPENFDEVLESLTSCATIALLHFKDVNTKLRIDCNKLVLDEPGYLQFKNRQKTSKEDIKNKNILDIAIINLQNWYPLNSPKRKAIQRIQAIAKLGLEKLQETYKKFSIEAHIRSYIVRIDEFLNRKEEEFNPIHSHLNEIMQSIWTEASLIHLAELFEQACQEENQSLKNDIIQEIQEFINHRVVHFQNKLRIDRNRFYSVNDAPV